MRVAVTLALMTRRLIALLLLATPAVAQDVHVRVQPGAPSASPGRPGSEALTTYPTIQNALDHHPFAGPGGRVYIEIAPGIYHERIFVTRNHQNITLLGTGAKPEDTVVTNSLNAKTAGGTFFTETAEIDGDGFEADNLTFENTAGNLNPSAGQAVAAAVRADRAVFKHVRFLGHQDTLFADYGRQYYLDCFIAGGVDFIFGNAAAVFDRSQLESNGPGYVTAQSRTSPTQATGYVILNSRITSALDPNAAGKMVGLGRPWRPYARVVYLNTELPAELDPAGWSDWGNPANQATAWYAEYDSTGAGAIQPGAANNRVPWAHTLTAAEVKRFLPANFLAGDDYWNPIASAAKLP